jgi:hypothetical protein
VGTIVRWPLLSILVIGLLNIPAWYGLSFWGLDWRLAVPILIGLAFTAGWYTQEKAWGTMIALLAPVMFIGGERHGRGSGLL